MTPLGSCSSLAPSHQNRVLSALRSTEVLADPTNTLALECALRLQAPRQGRRQAAGPAPAVHLAASHRLVRAQPVPKRSGFAQHFRMFALASGALERQDHAFTVETLTGHIRTMLQALRRLEGIGYTFGNRRLEILATTTRAELGDRVAEAVEPAATRTLLKHPYYTGGLRYSLWVTAPDGDEVPIAGGGTFDWLARLTSNRRMAYVASGLGAQLVAVRFDSADPACTG